MNNVTSFWILVSCILFLFIQCQSDTIPYLVFISKFEGKLFADTESYYDAAEDSEVDRHSGGVSLLSSLIQNAQQEKNAPFFLVGNSNNLFGSAETYYTSGEWIVKHFRYLPTAAIVLGPNDFYFKYDVLIKMIRDAQAIDNSQGSEIRDNPFAFLAANIDTLMDQSIKKDFDSYIFLPNDRNPVIAIIGILPEDTFKYIPENLWKQQYQLNDPVETVKTLSKTIRELHNDVAIYVVGYFQKEQPEHQVVIRNLASVQDVALVIGVTQNSNALKENNVIYIPHDPKIATVLSPEQYIETRKILETPILSYDPQLSKSLSELRSDIQQFRSTEIGNSTLSFDYSVNKDNQMAHLITDLIYTYISDQQKDRSRAPIDGVLLPGGMIKKGLKKGIISKLELYDILPFDDNLVLVNVTGKQIVELIHHSLSNVNIEGFLHPSHTLTFNYSVGSDGTIHLDPNYIYVNHFTLDIDREYRLAIPGNIAAGKYGYSPILKGTQQSFLEKSVRDIVEKQISKINSITIPSEYRIVQYES